jgi:arylsulfatase A-like enzyme
MAIDLLPTFCSMANVRLPKGLEIDGRDLSGVLTLGAKSPHDELVLFDNEDVAAIRTQRWKYVYYDYVNVWRAPVGGKYPQLYDMELDPSESYNFADRHPEVLKEMQARFERAQREFDPFRTAPKRKDYPV